MTGKTAGLTAAFDILLTWLVTNGNITEATRQDLYDAADATLADIDHDMKEWKDSRPQTATEAVLERLMNELEEQNGDHE